MNLICKGLAAIKNLYEMLQTKIFSYDVSSIKILSISKSFNILF